MVEIFIPTYNRAAFLADAIDSALAQDYPNVRVIVVDNCSTDNTRDVVARYAARPNFQYHLNQTNIGLIPNLNECVRRRTEGYFTFFGSDDALRPSFASSMVRGFAAFENVDIVGADCTYARDSIHNVEPSSPGPSAPPRMLLAQEILEDTVLTLAAFMTRPGLRFQFDERLTYSADQRLFRQWVLEAARICYLPEKLTIYCLHEGQATQIDSTLLQYSEVMSTGAWAAQEMPEFYASILMGRLNHCAYIRSQRQRSPHTSALLGILERLIRARYVMATLHIRGLEAVFNVTWADVLAAEQDLIGLINAMNNLVSAAPGQFGAITTATLTTSLAFPEDAPGGVRLGHYATVGSGQSLAVLAEAISRMHDIALQAERFLPVAEAIDNAQAGQGTRRAA